MSKISTGLEDVNNSYDTNEITHSAHRDKIVAEPERKETIV